MSCLQVSELHRDVSATLRNMGLTVHMEQPMLSGMFSVDVLLPSYCGVPVVVEVDGPEHYAASVRAAAC